MKKRWKQKAGFKARFALQAVSGEPGVCRNRLL